MQDKPGRFITFEGGEGAGKSTQVRRLKARLEGQGTEVVLTREPGGSARAEIIRDFVLSGAVKTFGAFAEAVLFGSARADHVDHVIRPALARGAMVICDRFVDSTRVYQGTLGQVPRRAVSSLERVTLGDCKPHLTLLLDVPTKLGLARAEQRRELAGEQTDRFEGESLSFHDQVREAFLAIAAAEPDRMAVVDASGAPDSVERVIWAEVEARLLTSAYS